MSKKKVIFMHFALVCLTCDVEVKVSRVKVIWVKVKGQIGRGRIRVPNLGRWAHINVKLLHFNLNLSR